MGMFDPGRVRGPPAPASPGVGTLHTEPGDGYSALDRGRWSPPFSAREPDATRRRQNTTEESCGSGPVSAVDRLARIPGLGLLLRLRHEWRARTTRRWRFYGVFESYDEALRGQPRRGDLPEGYQAPGVARQGGDFYGTMQPFDYPAVHWLDEYLPAGGTRTAQARTKVFDLGGHLGEKREVWARYVPRIREAEWTVCETEDAVREGRARGLEGGLVRFGSDPRAMDGADLLVASGSLQYLPWELAPLLAGLRRPPPRLILNKVPLSDGPSFWTLQNLGTTSVPYRVFHGPDFVRALEEVGYEVEDRWQVPGLSARVPFRPELGTRANAGLALRRAG